MRFQKRIKILPGVRINLSKSGISTSLGRPGATVNIGAKGSKFTGGIPGTGLSHTVGLGEKERASRASVAQIKSPDAPQWHDMAIGIAIFVAVITGLAWLLSKA